MLVGLSQGGMDAQNIANSGKFNVTNLVTYGSPVNLADDPKINTVHIRAEGNPVPAAGEAVAAAARTATNPLSAVLPKQALPLVYAAEVLAPRSDHVFTHDSPNDGQGMQVHEHSCLMPPPRSTSRMTLVSPTSRRASRSSRAR